jgi:RES domain-containing protein
MNLFRLCREKYALPFSGVGASLVGGRWNSKGVEVIYTAENRSLAMAEVIVHFTLATRPLDYMMLTIEYPDSISSDRVDVHSLPDGWNSFPHIKATQHIGDRFILEQKHCLLYVPSAITQGDCNVLINPRHRDFKKIKVKSIEPFPFNERLIFK